MRRPHILFAVSILPFLILATLNSAGYRYGASDQAFYIPAILYELDPSLFPRDSELIGSQAKLTVIDEAVASLVRLSGLSLPLLFAVLYVVALSSILFGTLRVGSSLYRTGWAMAALAAAMTLRHAIMKTGTNTLEGYFHPRQLAFGLGLIAVAALLRGGPRHVVVPLAAAALVHPTTALWFVIWLGIAMFLSEPRLRMPLLAAAILAGAAGLWALTAGPLEGRLVRMDDEWLATLIGKDYLFPLEWPVLAWLINAGYVPLILWIFVERRARGLLMPREQAVVFGALSLAVVFVGAVVLHPQRIAIAIQLQPARVFWMLDFVATVYVVWALAEWPAPSRRRGVQVLAAILLFSCARGGYVLAVRFPDRPVAQFDVRDDDWGRVMAWARSSARDSYWLADPYHASRYGTSIRVAGHRDVFLEVTKDTAIGMYDRPMAMRTRERAVALQHFATLSPDGARDLAQRYGLDYLVAESELELPIVLRSGAIRVYRLR